MATKHISQSRVPLIHEVIPIFDVITTALDDFTDDTKLSPCVRAAALRGQTMLNKYYALTDESIVFRVAMSVLFLTTLRCYCWFFILLVLHPKYKTMYFAKAKWPREWIQTAEDLVRHEWETYYKLQTNKKTAEPNVKYQLL